MRSAYAPTVRTAARTILASSIASLLLAGLAHGVTWSGTQLLELGDDPGGDDVDLLSSTVVTLDGAAGTLLENVIFNGNPGASTTLTVNNAAGPTRVLAANATVLGAGNGKSLVVAGSADFRIGAVSDGGFANMELVKNGGAGELILDNLASDLDGATLRVVDGTMSIFGGGGTTSAVDTLIQPIRIDGAAGKLRLGSLGSVGTTFNNNLAVNESGTLEHTAATHDTLGGIVALAAGKTLNANVTGGSLRLAGSFSRGGNSNLAKNGAGTLFLSGFGSGTGLTNVNAGTLQYSMPGALYGGATASWTAANITVESGATLAVNVGGPDFSPGDVSTLLAQISTVANNGLKAGATVGFDTTNAVGAVSYASPITDSAGAGGGAVSVTKLGAGTLTLGGVNTHSGATTVSAGTLALAAGGAIANSSGISVAAGATYDVSAVPGYTLAQSLSAKTAGTANVVGALNAGAQTISLQDGANIGTLALGSTLTLSGATLRFDLSETTSDQITVGGNVTMSGTNIIDVARLAFATGLATGAQAYTLITAGGGLVSGNFSLSNSLITIGSTNYTLTLSGTATHQYLGVATGSVAVPTTYTLATSVSAQSIRLGTGTSTITTTLTNTGTVAANSDSLSYTSLGSTVAPGGGVTLGAPAAGGTLAPNAAGTAQTVANQTFSSSVAGSYLVTASAGTVTNATVGGSPTLQGGVGTATVNVYRLAAPNAISSPLTFSGNHHVGDVVATQTLSLTNTAAADGFSERLDGVIAASTGGALGSGSVSLLVPGANSTALQVGLDTSEVGALSGTVTVGLTSNGAGTSGLGTLALASQVITVNAGSVFRLAAPSTISGPVTFSGNYHVGDVVPGQTLVVSNDAAADGFSEHLDAAFTGSTGGATGTGTITLLAPETENSTGLIVGLDTSSVGAKSGTVTVGLTSNGAGTSLLGTTALTPQVVTVNAGSVFRLAAPNTISANVNLGRVRVGGAFGTATLSLTNVAAAGAFTEGLNATFASMSGTATHNSGAISNLAGGASDSASLVVGLGGAANTATPGAASGTVTVGLASNGTASGLADTALPAQVVSVSGFVYSGLGVWNLPGSGTWAAIPNWQANGGVPGLDAGFEATDTATFSSATTGDATVSLQGVSPSLKTVVFDNAAHDYEIDNAGGGGLKLDNGASNATVTNSAGNHLISAPVELRSNASVAVSGAGDVLAITGAVTQSGTRSLTKTGDGTLNLGGNQLYDTLTTTGGVTNIDGVLGAGAGTASVQANATTRFGSVSQSLASLTIGPRATVVFTSGAAGFSGGGKGSSAGGSAVVPEPSALGLLLVGALGMLTRRRRE